MGRRSLIGWSLVLLQAVLIGGAVLLDGPRWWELSPGVTAVARILALLALAFGAVGLFNLGPALTASPVPNEAGRLRTDGVYSLVRHPVYTGLLTGLGIWALASGSSLRIISWLLLVILIVVKSRWEEGMLAERFPEYAAYRETTPAFIPRLRRRS